MGAALTSQFPLKLLSLPTEKYWLGGIIVPDLSLKTIPKLLLSTDPNSRIMFKVQTGSSGIASNFVVLPIEIIRGISHITKVKGNW